MKRLILSGLLLLAAGLHAQSTNESVIDRAQQPKPPATPGAATESTAAQGGDQDAGTQRVAQRRSLPIKFFVSYDTQVYFTDNVFLSPHNPVDALIFANTLSLRAEAPAWAVANGLLTPSLGFTYQRYNHGIGTGDSVRKSLDFDSYSIPLNFSFRFGENWEADLGFTPSYIYRLNGTPDYQLIYSSYTPSISLHKLVSLGRNQILSMAAGASYSFTDASAVGVSSDRNNKADLSANAGYYYLHDKWVLGPYGSLTRSIYRDYQEFGPVSVDRNDTTYSIGASATYNFTRWASARVFTSYDWRISSELYSYEAKNIGVGATFNASF